MEYNLVGGEIKVCGARRSVKSSTLFISSQTNLIGGQGVISDELRARDGFKLFHYLVFFYISIYLCVQLRTHTPSFPLFFTHPA